MTNDDRLLADLLGEDDVKDDMGRHCYVMGLVYEVDADTALSLAQARAAGSGDAWQPTGDAADVQGPYCVKCGKFRGPKAVETFCAGDEPDWRRIRRAEGKLKLLPRSNRRDIEKRRRRAERSRGWSGPMSGVDDAVARAVIERAERPTPVPDAVPSSTEVWSDPVDVVLE